ncbi:MAG: Coenzyme F420 hydrogenase/dehydrogenase, beta subunit C-terminal domain [Thermoproteota archaeon]|nr:Coenzyme F420 hydrogenase/dehydrogenase, beta subunit C-terminal domain [Thermoproteota archaeon]
MTEKSKLSFEETLGKFVLPEKCIGCAACVITCPFDCLEYVRGKPEITSECKACGICSQVCPQYNPSHSALENFVYGRKRKPEEEFGVYQQIVVAKSTDKKILKASQDGGVVTTLLTFALKNKRVDGAAVSRAKKGKPLHPIPNMATTPLQILQSAGTKYFYSPNLLAFQKGIEQNRKKLAFVGTPCQIEAIRRIQMIPLKDYVEKLELAIGLMCSGSFHYEGLVEKYIKGKLHVNPSNISKINIKKKVLLTMKSGETKVASLEKVKPYIRRSCRTCTDFSAELADISVGGLGLRGWSIAIIRTKTGEKLFTDAVKAKLLKIKSIEEQKHARNLLVTLSKRQRKKNL